MYQLYLYVLAAKTPSVFAKAVGIAQGRRNWPGRPGNCRTKVSCTSREPGPQLINIIHQLD